MADTEAETAPKKRRAKSGPVVQVVYVVCDKDADGNLPTIHGVCRSPEHVLDMVESDANRGYSKHTIMKL